MRAPNKDAENDERPEDVEAKIAPAAGDRKVLRLEDVAAADDIRLEWVSVPEWAPAEATEQERAEWGLFVRALNGRERAKWQTDITIQKGKNSAVDFLQMNVSIIQLAACDANGDRLFQETDKRLLLRKSSAVLERIGSKAMELSDIGDDEMESLAGKSPNNLEDD